MSRFLKQREPLLGKHGCNFVFQFCLAFHDQRGRYPPDLPEWSCMALLWGKYASGLTTFMGEPEA